MRIAQLSTRFPPGPGGVERHVFEVSRRLVRRGASVEAFASDLYQEFPWTRLGVEVPLEEVVEGIQVHRLPVWTLPGELHYPFFRGLRRSLNEAQPDVLHVHTYGTNHAAVARRYARSHRVPYVLTAHYHPIWSIHGGWLRRQIRAFYDHRLARSIVGDAARLIVQTQEEERLVRANGFPLPKTEVVPPGYTPLPPPTSWETLAASLLLERPYLLFVGRLASNKGLLDLLEAFDALHRSDSSARLVVIGGDGGMAGAVQLEVARRGLAGVVRLTGHIEDERLLSAAYANARATVLPSEYEAFGLVLLESLAHATPVIATRVGGIPEVIEDGKAGRLVPRGDVPALTRALLELWNDEGLAARWGGYGRANVVPRYAWDAVVDRLDAIYREVRAS